jgi:archaellum component FlaF (FlaF/FlaG flagellin family)
MNEWAKLIIALLIWATTFYSTANVIFYRVEKLEKDFGQHIATHEQQNKEIMNAIMELKIEVARLADKK